jgi:hypothetical protein
MRGHSDSYAQLRLDPYISGLTLPVGFVQDPNNQAVQYVVEQRGVFAYPGPTTRQFKSATRSIDKLR